MDQPVFSMSMCLGCDGEVGRHTPECPVVLTGTHLSDGTVLMKSPYGEHTMREMVEGNAELQAILSQPHATYDYAIPQGWWDRFHEVMGRPPLCMVWLYRPDAIWGEPYPVTMDAKNGLAEFKRRFTL